MDEKHKLEPIGKHPWWSERPTRQNSRAKRETCAKTADRVLPRRAAGVANKRSTSSRQTALPAGRPGRKPLNNCSTITPTSILRSMSERRPPNPAKFGRASAELGPQIGPVVGQASCVNCGLDWAPELAKVFCPMWPHLATGARKVLPSCCWEYLSSNSLGTFAVSSRWQRAIRRALLDDLFAAAVCASIFQHVLYSSRSCKLVCFPTALLWTTARRAGSAGIAPNEPISGQVWSNPPAASPPRCRVNTVRGNSGRARPNFGRYETNIGRSRADLAASRPITRQGHALDCVRCHALRCAALQAQGEAGWPVMHLMTILQVMSMLTLDLWLGPRGGAVWGRHFPPPRPDFVKWPNARPRVKPEDTRACEQQSTKRKTHNEQ